MLRRVKMSKEELINEEVEGGFKPNDVSASDESVLGVEDTIFEDDITEEEGDDVIDTSEGEVGNLPLPEVREEELELPDDGKKFDDLTHYEKIKMASQSHGVTVKEPKKDCKSCYGRGYISTRTVSTPVVGTSGLPTGEINTQILPNPCKCMFKKEDIPKMFVNENKMTKKQLINMDKKLSKIKRARNPKIIAENKRLADIKRAKKKKKKKLNKKRNK